MLDSKSKLWLGLTIVVAIITCVLLFSYLKGVKQAAENQVMTNVVITTQKISQGTQLTKEMVKTAQIPAKSSPPQTATDAGKVIGQFTTVDLWPGEIIITGKLASDKTSTELPYILPEGKRAITIAIDSVSGLAGHIKPGYYVDVLAAYEIPDKQKETKVVTLLQTVPVLAVGLDKKAGDQVPENVTLAVTPPEVQRVMLIENIGKIKLSLRPAADDQKVQLKSSDLQELQNLYP